MLETVHEMYKGPPHPCNLPLVMQMDESAQEAGRATHSVWNSLSAGQVTYRSIYLVLGEVSKLYMNEFIS